MAYEYRSGSQTFELPNPYAVENKVRFILGGVLVLIGIALLFVTRERLAAGWNAATLFPLVAGVALMGYGVKMIGTGMTQLRFLFGRDRPRGLAPELAQDQYGGSPAGRALQETVRRGALHFPEPQGALNGWLYNLYKNLIYAVLPLQVLAQAQFRIALVVLAILASLVLSWLLLGRAEYAQWLGLMYFALTTAIVIHPMRKLTAMHASSRLPVLLAVLAILGPIVVTLAGRVLPALGGVNFLAATLCMLLAAGAGAAMFFVALKAQLGDPPPASSSMQQLALSMNCLPTQVQDELARRLQEQWREQIPNRRYLLARPDINVSHEGSGSFAAEVLEETQPFPASGTAGSGLGECFADPRRQPVLLLMLFGALLITASAIIIAIGAWQHTPEAVRAGPAGLVNTALFSFAGMITGAYCFNGAHQLFGRFDFDSQLIWFELAGNYQVAALDYGNVLSDRIKTRKNLVNIETATLRVWMVEIRSVVFGKDGERIVAAMFGRKEEAAALANSLAEFAREQSVVVAPTAAQDAAKINAMAQTGVANPTLGAREQAALFGQNPPSGEPPQS